MPARNRYASCSSPTLTSQLHVKLIGSIDYVANGNFTSPFNLHSQFSNPKLIFFVGDVTADGELCSDREWNAAVQRFQSIFALSYGRVSYVLPGNHDIGLHYSVTDARLRRFEHSFHSPHVRLISIKSHHVHFVLINSMAFEGDHCRLCQRAEQELNDVIEQLNRTGAWTKPILLSHFPLYRSSDVNCSRSSSSVPLLQVSGSDRHRSRLALL